MNSAVKMNVIKEQKGTVEVEFVYRDGRRSGPQFISTEEFELNKAIHAIVGRRVVTVDDLETIAELARAVERRDIADCEF